MGIFTIALIGSETFFEIEWHWNFHGLKMYDLACGDELKSRISSQKKLAILKDIYWTSGRSLILMLLVQRLFKTFL